jgi:hypothetical protein
VSTTFETLMLFFETEVCLFLLESYIVLMIMAIVESRNVDETNKP